MYFDWKSLISDLIQFFLTYLWCISIVDCTLFQKEKLSQKIRKWFIVICFISIIYFTLYVGMVYFDAYISIKINHSNIYKECSKYRMAKPIIFKYCFEYFLYYL